MNEYTILADKHVIETDLPSAVFLWFGSGLKPSGVASSGFTLTGKYVFDNGKGKPLHQPDYYTKEFIKILGRAEIRGASLHTLRHTFASYLVMAGVDLRTVQEFLGHSTVKVTEQYSHLSPEHRARAVGVLDFETKLKQFEPNSSPAPAKSLPFK